MPYLLIVDDDEDFALAAATTLRDAGYEVLVELDIKSAENSMLKRRPDLIILDVMFPESSSAGFTLARKIKTFDDKFKDMPILILTAVNSKFPLGFSTSDIDETWLPVGEFLEKPMELDLLISKISKMLS